MKSNKLKINNRGGVNMKTLTKMFLLSCWCLISVSFAKETLDEIKANQEQQLIQQKLEVLNPDIDTKPRVFYKNLHRYNRVLNSLLNGCKFFWWEIKQTNEIHQPVT